MCADTFIRDASLATRTQMPMPTQLSVIGYRPTLYIIGLHPFPFHSIPHSHRRPEDAHLWIGLASTGRLLGRWRWMLIPSYDVGCDGVGSARCGWPLSVWLATIGRLEWLTREFCPLGAGRPMCGCLARRWADLCFGVGILFNREPMVSDTSCECFGLIYRWLFTTHRY